MTSSVLEDPKVKNAIRVLQYKGVTLKEIEEVYKYYEQLRSKHKEGNREYLDLMF